MDRDSGSIACLRTDSVANRIRRRPAFLQTRAGASGSQVALQIRCAALIALRNELRCFAVDICVVPAQNGLRIGCQHGATHSGKSGQEEEIAWEADEFDFDETANDGVREFVRTFSATSYDVKDVPVNIGVLLNDSVTSCKLLSVTDPSMFMSG